MQHHRAALEALVRTTADETRPHVDGGPARLPNGADAAVCAHGALYLQRVAGGVVLGYRHDDNPTASLGAAEGGHDFLLVDDRFVVDLWGYDYDGRVPTGVLDLQDPSDASVIARLYGDAARWELVEPT
jgi:hypothetical protein